MKAASGGSPPITFAIRLPAVAEAEGVAPASVLPPSKHPHTKGSPRVLVVDDNVDSADTMAMLLTELGCETRVAYDGPSALARLDSFHPRLALLDIGLPGMDGYELARRIRLRPDSATVRLIAVTGYSQKRDLELAQSAGFDEHLVKPIEFETIEALLKRLGLTLGGI